MIPSAVQRHRDRGCAACLTPCPLRHAHAGACDVCPLSPPAWHQWDCRTGSQLQTPSLQLKLGDRIAAEIENRVLKPAERYMPAIVAAVRNCGGCKESQRHLNGGGILPGEGEGPPVV